MSPIRTIILDDERFACERLKKLLCAFPETEIVDCLTNSKDGLSCILKEKQDLVFPDIELENNTSAFDLIDKIKEKFIKTNIILVTAFTQYSIKAIKNEVFDYLLKPVDIDELKSTIKRYINKLSPKTTNLAKEFPMLSGREIDVLECVFEGKSSREIADILFISLNTVHTHRRNILKKTNSNNVIDLFRLRKIYDQ